MILTQSVKGFLHERPARTDLMSVAAAVAVRMSRKIFIDVIER